MRADGRTDGPADGGTADQPTAGPPVRPAVLPTVGRLLAVDLGDKRIGLAVSDPSQMVARPLAVLSRRAGQRFPYPALAPHLVEVAGVVVGLPLTPEGGEGARAAEARAVAALIARRSTLPVDLWDERFTTARALGAAREAGVRLRGRKPDVDPRAAAVLLQHYLDARHGGTT